MPKEWTDEEVQREIEKQENEEEELGQINRLIDEIDTELMRREIEEEELDFP